MAYTSLEIQQRLQSLGYDPGPIDGIRGRRTIAAIRLFQTASGLRADGVVGPVTRAKLFAGVQRAEGAQEPDRPWYEEARRLLGTAEVAGRDNNRIILDWARDLEVAYSKDETPWCGLFVAHCIGSTLPEEDLPTGLLGARNWQRFGRTCEPTKGCILVFWRTDRTRSHEGHVGFYAGEDTEGFYVLGGNQSDRVSIVRISRERFLAARWPETATFGEQVRVTLATTSDAFSTDEA